MLPLLPLPPLPLLLLLLLLRLRAPVIFPRNKGPLSFPISALALLCFAVNCRLPFAFFVSLYLVVVFSLLYIYYSLSSAWHMSQIMTFSAAF